MLQVQSIKLSGLKKSAYLTSLKTLESILDLCPKTSMRDMAVQFGCLEALDLASKVLDRYVRMYSAQSAKLDNILVCVTKVIDTCISFPVSFWFVISLLIILSYDIMVKSPSLKSTKIRS